MYVFYFYKPLPKHGEPVHDIDASAVLMKAELASRCLRLHSIATAAATGMFLKAYAVGVSDWQY
jgi:hypothetical protein